MPSTERPTSGRTPDMGDVAALAGVSKQTVSRALSNHPNVTPRTRAKVEAAVAQLGYRRNAAASTLSSGRSRTIGIVSMPTVNSSSAVFDSVTPCLTIRFSADQGRIPQLEIELASCTTWPASRAASTASASGRSWSGS